MASSSAHSGSAISGGWAHLPSANCGCPSVTCLAVAPSSTFTEINSIRVFRGQIGESRFSAFCSLPACVLGHLPKSCLLNQASAMTISAVISAVLLSIAVAEQYFPSKASRRVPRQPGRATLPATRKVSLIGKDFNRFSTQRRQASTWRLEVLTRFLQHQHHIKRCAARSASKY